jgi:hypothetical protein
MKSDVSEVNMNEVRGLLLKIIHDMPDSEKRKLLKELKSRHIPKPTQPTYN